MMMLSHILHSRARRARDQEQKPENGLPVSDAVKYARRFRRGLAIVLLAAGVISFVELVWLPGKLVRRNLNPAVYPKLIAADEDEELRLPPWLMGEEQKNRLRENKVARIEQKLRSRYKKIGDSSVALRKAYAELDTQVQRMLGLSLQLQPASVTTALTDVVNHESTARLAWSNLAKLAQQFRSADHDTRELVDVIGGRFTSGTFLVEDDQDMQSTIRSIDDLTTQLTQAHTSVDHLSILIRERAALARQNRMDVTKQGAFQ